MSTDNPGCLDDAQRVTVAPFAMPKASMDRLRARAAADDRSIAATIRVAIERFLEPDGRVTDV